MEMAERDMALVAEGFPPDLDPRLVAGSITQATGIHIQRVALAVTDISHGPSDTPTCWLLRLNCHEDKKRLLHNHRTIPVVLGSGTLHIKLNPPNLSLTFPSPEAWMTMDEGPNSMDSVKSTELFGSGHKECPGSGPPQGLLGPGEFPQGDEPHGAQFTSQPPMQYPPGYYSQGYPPAVSGMPHPAWSDPSFQTGGGGRPYYPPSGYQPHFGHGEGGPHMGLSPQSPPYLPYMPSQAYQQGLGPQSHPRMDTGVEQGFSEMSFEDRGYQQQEQYTDYSGHGDMDFSRMDSDFVVLDHEGTKHQFYLQVTDLPPQVTEQELREFFGNRHESGGGSIDRVLLDPSGTAAAIYFTDAEVIQRVVQRAPHLLRNKKIAVAPALENHQAPLREETRTVEIRGCEDESLTEMCMYYFENPAKGGGDIKESQWDEQEKVFYITFVDPAVARDVASRGHKVGGKVLEVALYEPQPEEEEDTGPQCKVEVRGFDPVQEELYQMYFENPRKGGGEITEFKMEEDVLYITFSDPEVAAHVVSTSHKVGGRALEVTLAPKEKPMSTPPCTVKVTGGDLEQEELYTMYFENPRKGGGAISSFTVEEKEQAIFITFEDPEVAEAVCNGQHKVGGRVLEVTLHIPRRGTQRQKSRDVSAEEEEPPLKTVEVTGSEPMQSDDTYLYYFENPRNGGGEVEEIDIDREKGIVFVTFASPEVAAKVAECSHTIGGQKVQVKLYVPPKPKPTYPNKLLFINVADSTTTDCLTMYLERITDLEPVEVLYGDEPGVVLVTFETEPDFEKTQAMCQKRKLESRQLQVSKVPISNCLLVEGLASSTTENTVELYFENKRRSGGGPVERVEITHAGDVHTGFVYFENHEDMGPVLAKPHRIDNKSLKVKCYMECLGLSGGSADPTVFALPKPLSLKDVDTFKIAFIRQSTAVKEEFAQQLAEVSAVPKFQNNTVTLECSLTKDIPKARILAKTWTNDAQRAATSFFSQIGVHRKDVMQQIWPEVEKSVIGSGVANRDETVMFPLAEETALVVVGKQAAASGLFEEIISKIKAIEEEVERKRMEVTETNGKLKIHQLRLLAAMSFHTEAAKRHPGLNVDIKTKKGEITFHGMMSDVKDAQVEMYDLLNSVKSEKITDLSDMQKKLLDKVETRTVIVQKFKPEQIVAVWEVGKDVTVHAFTDDSVVKSVRIIRKSVVEHVIQFTPESSELQKSREWQDLIRRHQEINSGKLLIIPAHNGQQLFITGTDDIMHGTVEEVERFLEENTIYSQVMRFSPCRQRFLVSYWQPKMGAIVNSLKAYGIQMSLRESGSELNAKGTREGLKQLKIRLEELEGKIVVHEELMTDAAKVKFLTSGKCEKDLDMLGRSCQCVISLEPEAPGLQVIGSVGHPEPGSLQTVDVKAVANIQLKGGITVSAVQGDITQFGVDVIVNAANDKMDHIGGLAKAIVDKGGKTIQQECREILKTKGGQLSEGEVLVSSPGKLPCKAIIHAVGPRYNGGHSGEEDCLFETVIHCLETASAARHASIAIPALSTGIFQYPPDQATRVIVEAVKSFFDSHRRHSIRSVHLIHISDDVVQHFCRALQKVFPSSHVATTVTKPKYERFPVAPSYTPQAMGRTSNSYTVINVLIVEGEIAQQRADVIVNSTSNNLDLKNGAVSSSILAVGGPGLQTECNTRYPNGITTGEIAHTSSHGLNCTEVFHVALCNWSNPNAEQVLSQLVGRCLAEASKRHYSSIAFPVLGTGNLGYPRDVVTQTMLGAINQFQQTTPSTSLREARIVIYHKDRQTIQDFHAAQARIGGRISSASSLAKGPSSRGSRRFSEGASSQPAAMQQHVGGSAAAAEFDIGGMRLVIKQGDITEQDVDAILNSSNSELDLSRGAVASALRNKCGKRLEQECRSKIQEMKQRGLVLTGSYALKSKVIMHIDAEKFNNDWEKGIKLCLKEAETNGVRSLAMPALGTGAYCLTPASSARALFNSLMKFSQSRQNLQELRVVLYERSMLPPFIGTIQSMGDQANDSKGGVLNWFKAKAGFGSTIPDIKQTHSAPEIREVKLYIYVESPSSVQSILRGFDDIVRDKFTKREFVDDTLINMGPEDLQQIRNVAAQHNVDLKIQTAMGRLVLEGLHTNVFEALQGISNVTRAAERQRQDELSASMLVNMVQWCYLEVGKTKVESKEYGPKENHIIEKAYQGKKKNAEIKDLDGKVYIIDFDSMMEHPQNDPSDTVQVIRRDKIKDMASGSLPENWATHNSNEQVKLVSLQSADAEYTQVHANFMKTIGSAGVSQIISIQRIQNQTLYRQYAAKKAHLERQNTGIENERTLWHGTAADAIDNINMYGFNRSYCGKNATVHGQGVYFAINSSYSAHPTYSPPNLSGERHVYQCKVLVGYATTGNQNLRVLPARSGPILYDSASDNPSKPVMFVIFNDTQAYPEYLISFK